MNAIYKVIWNDAIRQYQVVNELCRSRRKACSVKAVHTDGFGRSLKRSVLATAAAVAMMAGGAAYAADITLGGLEINVGSKNTSNVTNFDQGQLPQNGDTIVIDIDKTNFAGLSDVFSIRTRIRVTSLFSLTMVIRIRRISALLSNKTVLPLKMVSRSTMPDWQLLATLES